MADEQRFYDVEQRTAAGPSWEDEGFVPRDVPVRPGDPLDDLLGDTNEKMAEANRMRELRASTPTPGESQK